jgi:hypothetical protein
MPCAAILPAVRDEVAIPLAVIVFARPVGVIPAPRLHPAMAELSIYNADLVVVR